jgi:hypothetical protein
MPSGGSSKANTMVSIPLIWNHRSGELTCVRIHKTPDLPDYITRGKGGAYWSGDNYIARKNAYHIYIAPDLDNPSTLSEHTPIEYCNGDWYILHWRQDSYYTTPDLCVPKGSSVRLKFGLSHDVCKSCQVIALDQLPEA